MCRHCNLTDVCFTRLRLAMRTSYKTLRNGSQTVPRVPINSGSGIAEAFRH
jgi:hypothetical protein